MKKRYIKVSMIPKKPVAAGRTREEKAERIREKAQKLGVKLDVKDV